MTLTSTALRRLRFAAQGLHAADRRRLPDVVRNVLAVQAQDLRSARLAIRARTHGLVAGDVDEALAEREVVVSWLMRGTLHLVHRDDYAWLWALTSPAVATSNRRRLTQEGVQPADAERALTVIESALSDGPMTRSELAVRLAGNGIRTEGQAMPHLLMLAALRGLVVLGPVHDGVQAFALTSEWIGRTPEPRDRPRAVAELVRRYLRGHGPATAADIATWSGIGLRDVRTGLAAIRAELDVSGNFVDLAGRKAPAALPCRLLPAFDPYLLGWRDRGFVVDEAHRRRVYPGGGMLRATAVADGRAVATWSLRRRGGTTTVDIDAFGEVDDATTAALHAEADDIARFEADAAGAPGSD